MRPSVKKLLLFGSTAPYSGAQLVLDFVGSRTSGQPYYMLNGVNYPSVSGVPGWTYTGGTAAGTGSYAAKADGSLQFFPSYTNLLLQSQTFDNASWVKNASTITADAIVAPDGTTTADKLVETSATDFHYALQTITWTAATYTSSVYLKAGERTWAIIGEASSGAPRRTWFNLSNGTVGTTAAGHTAAVVALGGGWYRCSVTFTAVAGSQWVTVNPSTGDNVGSYAGTAGSGIYIWGAQLELGSTASTYIPTTTAAVTVGTPRITDAGYWAEEARTNSLTYSDQFDNAAWTKVEATVTANQSTAPDGTLTADLITTTVAGNPRVYQQLGISGNGSAYTGSVFVKAGTTTEANALLYVNSGTPASVTMTANILSGPGSITSAGVISGLSTTQWTRIGLTGTPSSASGNLALYIRPRLSGSTIGDTIYVWGAQLELGAFATSPIPTTSVAVTRAADVGYLPLTGPTDGTMFAEGSVLNVGASPVMLGHNSANTTGLYVTSTNGNHWNGTATIGNTGTVSIYPAITRMALAYTGTSSRSLSVNASAVTTSATTVGTINRIAVGTPANLVTPAQSAQAPIRRIVIYPRAFANSELQAITTAGAY